MLTSPVSGDLFNILSMDSVTCNNNEEGVFIMNEHVIDILGVGSREDSYTDLLAHAFENDLAFRNNILNLMQEQASDEWEVKVRPPVAIKSKTGRKKDIPDMLFVNKSKSRVIILENKIFSGEGWEQTERYASEDFKRALNEYLKIRIGDVKYFFLTLYGSQACSPKFKTLSYSDIAKCISGNHGSSNLKILLRELKERINELDSWPVPRDNDPVLNYLKTTKRLVNSFKTFSIVAYDIVKPDFGMNQLVSITSNRGSGYIPLCLWYKDKWNGSEYQDGLDGNKCYEVHFEFQWDTRTDWENLTLYLHYHTHPYMRQKEFMETSLSFQSQYKEARDKLFYYLKDNGPDKWVLNKTALRLAYFTFEKDIKYAELKDKVNDLICDMVPLIDRYI